jgi:hypothetical protein
MLTNYVYLLREREFIKSNEEIYKIGKTTKPNHTRFNQYPKGSVLMFQIMCNDCSITEKNIISIFKTKFNHQKDIGSEYFEGDYTEMMAVMYSVVSTNWKPDIIEPAKIQQKDIGREYFEGDYTEMMSVMYSVVPTNLKHDIIEPEKIQQKNNKHTIIPSPMSKWEGLSRKEYDAECWKIRRGELLTKSEKNTNKINRPKTYNKNKIIKLTSKTGHINNPNNSY